MPTRLRPTKVSNVIPKELQKLINDFKRGPKVIQATLSVLPEHDYWWFLEYGTGPFHEPDQQLDPPAEVAAYDSSGGPYEIEAQGEGYLVYMSHGRRMRRRETVHPGIKPLAFVRTALFEAELFLMEDIQKLSERKGRLLTRQEVVDTVNYIMEVLLGELRLTTPDDSDSDPYHTDRPHTPPLSESWRITKAR
jgi:hypothetical protein